MQACCFFTANWKQSCVEVALSMIYEKVIMLGTTNGEVGKDGLPSVTEIGTVTESVIS